MKSERGSVVSFAILGVSLALAAANAAAQPNITRDGTYQLTLPESDRRYTLIIPRGYLSAQSVPLIVSLHYGGRVTRWFGRNLLEQLIEPSLRELGAVIVAPDSAADDWANPTAEQHVLELVEYIEANFKIDASRTLLTGYSMGGAGTWYLAQRHPEIFEAAIPIAGRPPAMLDEASWQTPTFVLNSTADELIPIAPARAVVAALQAQGAPVEMKTIDRITHYQVPGYRQHLRETVSWIERAWRE